MIYLQIAYYDLIKKVINSNSSQLRINKLVCCSLIYIQNQHKCHYLRPSMEFAPIYINRASFPSSRLLEFNTFFLYRLSKSDTLLFCNSCAWLKSAFYSLHRRIETAHSSFWSKTQSNQPQPPLPFPMLQLPIGFLSTAIQSFFVSLSFSKF